MHKSRIDFAKRFGYNNNLLQRLGMYIILFRCLKD